ncbi:TOMM precursor leader peptide-binding protein [Salinibacterium sp. ZJ450]|uniref:TOMM precursor leader peptide-binding protein n=1 Tax=Salinibacterium sp. ZJ450 TaxID=2708338 RepID=UPI001423B7D6|nr:TOMM precursor leader peptide-binding protein [Salinibacterium sp. ZJ450]
MTLALDARYPAVWRSPTVLQLGAPDAVAVLADVTPVQERLIAALAVGASRAQLAVIARTGNDPDSVVDELLATVRPALVVTPPPGTVAVAGIDPAVDRLADMLGWQGVRTVTVPTPDAAATVDADVAIIVASFVIDPGFHGVWLRRDIPHLPLVLGGAQIRIGPFVDPGVSACLHCVARWRADADPAWPAIASQLWGRRAPLETPLVLGEAIGLACRLTLRRLAGVTGLTGEAEELCLDARTGEVSRVPVSPHPACECGTLGL